MLLIVTFFLPQALIQALQRSRSVFGLENGINDTPTMLGFGFYSFHYISNHHCTTPMRIKAF